MIKAGDKFTISRGAWDMTVGKVYTAERETVCGILEFRDDTGCRRSWGPRTAESYGARVVQPAPAPAPAPAPVFEPGDVVECVDDSGLNFSTLTVGVDYLVDEFEHSVVRLVDDTGSPSLYLARRFRLKYRQSSVYRELADARAECARYQARCTELEQRLAKIREVAK